MREKIMMDKSSFGIMDKIDFCKFPKTLEFAIMAILPAGRNFQSLPLNLNSNFGD
jgi:hypothetical protein